MVRTGKILAYALFFVLSLMYLMPKAGIYYFAEEQLKPYSVVINNEHVQERGLGLKITDATLFISSIESAQIGAIELDLFGLFNAIDITDVTLSSVAAAVMPVHIHEIRIRYSVLNPLQIEAEGEAEAGVFHATFHLLDRVVNMNLKPSESMLKNYKSTLSNMKPSENGEYLYEKSL